MKKTLAALAAASAFAGSASAGDVQIYGIIDYGLKYTRTHIDDFDGTSTSKDAFGLQAGLDSGPRICIKGAEDLGNGLKVGFKFENGFQADDGTLKYEGRLWGREAALSLYSDYGALSVGRIGGLASGFGSYNTVIINADAFNGGDNYVLGIPKSTRYDNSVVYQSPEFSGMQVTAMYSFKGNNVKVAGDEGKSSADRYAALAAKGKFGRLTAVAAYELQLYKNTTLGGDGKSADNGQAFYIGGHYDASITSIYALAEYFDGIRATAAYGVNDIMAQAEEDHVFHDGIKGFGLHLGARTPAAGGTLITGLYYVDYKIDNLFDYEEPVGRLGSMDSKYLGAAARFQYPFTKRTFAYIGAGIGRNTVDAPKSSADSSDYKHMASHAYIGLAHSF